VSGAAIAVLLIAGLAVLQVTLLIWIWHRIGTIGARLAAEIESDTVLRPPENGQYIGATAPGYPFWNNFGQIALTTRRLVFTTVTGKTIEIPLSEITGISESRVYRGGTSIEIRKKKHLVIELESGEVSFSVRDNTPWTKVITRAIGDGAA